MNSLTDFTIKWQYPQPIGHHMRGKTIQISSFQAKNYTISTVLWILSHLAQWHNVLAFRTSGTSGKLRHFWNDPLACWHTSGMLACWHTHWHSRQTHGIQTNDDHHPLNLVDSDSRLLWPVYGLSGLCRSLYI